MKKGHIYHVYYRRSGGYRFIGKNSLKLLISLLLLGVAIYLFNEYVFNVSDATKYITEQFSIPVVLSTLLISELTLGLLAPELYITWIAGFANPWGWLFILATISYVGGIGAYLMGRKLDSLPRIHSWVHVKFANQFKQIKKFGGLLIVIAAFTPLPYPPICLVSGVVKFPFRSFLILTISRYLRFIIYGAIIFKVM